MDRLVRNGRFRCPAHPRCFVSVIRLLERSAKYAAQIPRSVIRGTLKTFGLVLDKGRGSVFEANVRELAGDQPTLWPLIEALLTVWKTLGEQISVIERRLIEQARRSEVCRRLMTIPGVGALTAVTFRPSICQAGSPSPAALVPTWA